MSKHSSVTAIGLDLDGVLADIAPAFLKYVEKEYGRTFNLEDITSYDATEWSGLNHDQVRHIFSETDIFKTLAPVPYSIDATRALKAAGWEILIITFRPWHDGLKEETKQWLDNYKYFYDTLHFSEDHDKTEYVHQHNIEVFVEDRLESAQLMSRVCHRVYLLDYPYNRGTIRKNVTRVSTWQEVLLDLQTSLYPGTTDEKR
jgi:uncharacterized HAD superfamily protein